VLSLALRILTAPVRAVGHIAARSVARMAGAFGAMTRPALARAVRAIGFVGAAIRAAAAILVAPVVTALFELAAPVSRAARRAGAGVRSSLGAEAVVGGWLRRPAGRFVLVAAITAVVAVSPRWAAVPIALLWFAAVAYAVIVLARGLSEVAAKRIRPRFEHAGRRAGHSVRVARLKAVSEASGGSRAPATAGPAVSAPEHLDERLRFHVSVHQNEFLPRNGTQVDAIITVTASRPSSVENGRRRSPERAEVILIDCSGSMAYPMARLRAAQAATGAAVDALHDGTWFAVVRANHAAEAVYPSTGLAQASPPTRAEAKRALTLLWPEGGTAMGKWLLLARDLLATRPGAIAHATLLTDGRNESETRMALDAALTACAGSFQCDCRGVGTDWEVSELRTIASALLGTVEIVAEPADLAADFRSMTRSAMGKLTGSVALRVWTPKGATLRALTQVSPTILDIAARRTATDALAGHYPTGAWGDESRQYHVSIRVPSKAIGQEMLAARIGLVVGSHCVEEALVKAIWTDDSQRSSEINREVAHFTGQAELANAIQDGLKARRAGDESTATLKLGRAIRLAAQSANHDTMKLLLGVLEVNDAATGSVRLKHDVAREDEMALDSRSTKTVALTERPSRSAQGASAPRCRRRAGSGAPAHRSL
jgi:hypothetical protein